MNANPTGTFYPIGGVPAMGLVLVLLSGCQSLGNQQAEPPSVKQISVNGTSITYLEQGKGIPICAWLLNIPS